MLPGDPPRRSPQRIPREDPPEDPQEGPPEDPPEDPLEDPPRRTLREHLHFLALVVSKATLKPARSIRLGRIFKSVPV